MSTPRVTSTALNTDSGPHTAILEQAGMQYQVCPRELNLYRGADLVAALEGISAVIAGSEPYPSEVLRALPELRVISRFGVGYDAIDLATCDELGIVVATTPGVNHHAVAEHTIAMLMAVGRGFPGQDQRIREGRWERIGYPRIMGSTLGLIGLGRIGQAVATRACGLGMQVVAYEPYPDMDFVERWGIELLDLDQLLGTADYVSVHSPLVPETRHLMNAERFGKMRAGSVFINTARGGLVDESALITALQSGHLRAAALDVFETEPLPLTSPLMQIPTVLLSGHIAGLDLESHRDSLTMAAETIVDLHAGGWPQERIVNLKGRTGWHWG